MENGGKKRQKQMGVGSSLLQPLKCQWNPRDALINLFTHNLPSPPAPLTEISHTTLVVQTDKLVSFA